MTTYAALLRGVNVGGKNRVPMADLRRRLGELAFEGVTTYLQSGNVILRSPAGSDAPGNQVRRAVREVAGIEIDVLVRTAEELSDIVGRNPFLSVEADHSKLHVLFCDREADEDHLAALDRNRSPGDTLAPSGREIFLHLAEGAGKTRLTLDYFERTLTIRGTARNWNTVMKLAALTA